MYRWIVSGAMADGTLQEVVAAEGECPEGLLCQLVQAAWLTPSEQQYQILHRIVGSAGLAYIGWHKPSAFGYPTLMVANVVLNTVVAYAPKPGPSGVVGNWHTEWKLRGYVPVLPLPRQDALWDDAEVGSELDLDGSRVHHPPAAGSGSEGAV